CGSQKKFKKCCGKI
ncbi:TPA: SEC-C metal-binding domain-containing protein, partial [Photobacterium damselae]